MTALGCPFSSKTTIRCHRRSRAVFRLLSIFVLLGFVPANVWATPLSIFPPTDLTLDGVPVVSGTFTLTGANAFSDPGGVMTDTVLIDQADIGDVVSVATTIGEASGHFLIDVPAATEVLRLQGFFSSGTPSLPNAGFDIILGVSQDVSTDAFTYFLPHLTSDFFHQVTDLGFDAGSTLDNANFFSTGADPVIALSVADPSLIGLRIVTLDNGTDNPWFVGLDDSSSTPFSIAQILAGAGGCSTQITGPEVHGRGTPTPPLVETECIEDMKEEPGLPIGNGTPTPIVPEPSSILLVGLGLVTLASRQRRRTSVR